MTPAEARAAIRAEHDRDVHEAHRLAAELGCEVTAHPQLVGTVEAYGPLPGVYVMVGGADEIRSEVRADKRRRGLREWLAVLGTLGT